MDVPLIVLLISFGGGRLYRQDSTTTQPIRYTDQDRFGCAYRTRWHLVPYLAARTKFSTVPGVNHEKQRDSSRRRIDFDVVTIVMNCILCRSICIYSAYPQLSEDENWISLNINGRHHRVDRRGVFSSRRRFGIVRGGVSRSSQARPALDVRRGWETRIYNGMTVKGTSTICVASSRVKQSLDMFWR